jgi:hypothetical protein
MRNKTMRIISTCAAAAAFLIVSAFGAFAAGSSPDTAAAPAAPKTMMHKKTMHHPKMHHSKAMYHKPHRKSAKYYGTKGQRKAALQHKTKKAAGSPASTY